MEVRLDRNALEGLLNRKRSHNCYRLATTTVVEHEYRGTQYGHPSSYAFARFECAPADELSFQSRASWPTTLDKDERIGLEYAMAECVADVLLRGIYQHSGCAITLIEVRWDDTGSGEAAFTKADDRAMQDLLAADWKIITKQK
jgi:hypothetical protein